MSRVQIDWSQDGLLDAVYQAYMVKGRSAAQIEREMAIPGLTRNAIIGHANRNGWIKGRQAGRATPKNTVDLPSPDKPAAVNYGKRFETKYPATATSKLLADLESNECQWPVGSADTPRDQLHCADRVASGKVYCPTHYAKAYTKGKPCEF